jgi:hypothetical protein
MPDEQKVEAMAEKDFTTRVSPRLFVWISGEKRLFFSNSSTYHIYEMEGWQKPTCNGTRQCRSGWEIFFILRLDR